MQIKVADQIVMKKISEIKPYFRNPRKNDKTVELLCEIIPKVGFNVPLVVDEKGVIIKGHARFTAAIRLGMTELPCIISHEDEDTNKADRLADNKISEFSEWINEEVMHEIDTINFDFDFADLGFPVVKFDDIPVPDFTEDDTEAPEISEDERKKLYEEFLEKQAKEAAPKVEIATERQIERAKEAQGQTATPPPKYYKVVCEKCGHIMFVKEGNLFSYGEGGVM